MTSINAYANKKTYKGFSGNGRAVGMLLRNAQTDDANKFLNYLAALKDKAIKTSPFACAEPHAVALALRAGAKLDDIRLDFEAKETGRTIEYCANCSKWINYDDGSLKFEVIRGSEKVAPEKVTYSVNLSFYVEQAFEKSGEAVPAAAPSSGWGTKDWNAHFTPAPQKKQTYDQAFPGPPGATSASTPRKGNNLPK